MPTARPALGLALPRRRRDVRGLRALGCHREPVQIGRRDGVELWDTRANEKWRSHAGIFGCAERVWDALRPKLENLIAALSGRKLRVSFVGHSLGGLILRAVACKLHNSVQFAPHCVMDTLICIAAPHLGCRLLGNGGKGGVAPLMTAFGPSLMRAGLRMIKGKLGPELLLDNDTLERLTDDEHVASMSGRAYPRACTGLIWEM